MSPGLAMPIRAFMFSEVPPKAINRAGIPTVSLTTIESAWVERPKRPLLCSLSRPERHLSHSPPRLIHRRIESKIAPKSHPLLGPPVVSANVIRGGVKDNIIPDYCELQIDRRRIPGEGPDQFDQELKSWADSMLSTLPKGSELQSVEINGRAPPARGIGSPNSTRVHLRLLTLPSLVTTSAGATRYWISIPSVPLAPYLDSLIRSARRYLFITATDTAPLCGAHLKAGMRRYFSPRSTIVTATCSTRHAHTL
jgi:hypothetical protein